jgi:hypothetical protein
MPPPAPTAILPIFGLCERKLLFVDIAVTIELVDEMGKIDDNESVDDIADVAIATELDAEETSEEEVAEGVVVVVVTHGLFSLLKKSRHLKRYITYMYST